MSGSAALRNEIMRLETAKAQKVAAQGAAQSFFKTVKGACVPPQHGPADDATDSVSAFHIIYGRSRFVSGRLNKFGKN